MQVHPDGAADFVRHRPAELPKGVRWMTRTGDQDAIGIVLPATAEPDGYTAEKAKGNVLILAPGAEWRCTMEFGVLDAETRGRNAQAHRGGEGDNVAWARGFAALPTLQKINPSPATSPG